MRKIICRKFKVALLFSAFIFGTGWNLSGFAAYHGTYVSITGSYFESNANNEPRITLSLSENVNDCPSSPRPNFVEVRMEDIGQSQFNVIHSVILSAIISGKKIDVATPDAEPKCYGDYGIIQSIRIEP